MLLEAGELVAPALGLGGGAVGFGAGGLELCLRLLDAAGGPGRALLRPANLRASRAELLPAAAGSRRVGIPAYAPRGRCGSAGLAPRRRTHGGGAQTDRLRVLHEPA